MESTELVRHLANIAEIAEDCEDERRHMLDALDAVVEYCRELIQLLQEEGE